MYCARTGLRPVCIQKEGTSQCPVWLFLLMVVTCLASFLAPWVSLGDICFPMRAVSARIILGVIFVFVFFDIVDVCRCLYHLVGCNWLAGCALYYYCCHYYEPEENRFLLLCINQSLWWK